MNWYKESTDFSDRNLLIHKIQYLKEIKDTLDKISKLVFQSGSIAKRSNVDILQSKRITSYPHIRDILIEADGIALDNPWKFADLCSSAIEEINNKILTFKKERDNFGKTKEELQKGWV